MAELLVSAVLPVLFEKLTSRELLNFATQEGVRSKLKKWEKTLKMIMALLKDAEKKQLDDEAVKMWLDELQDLAYDAEDILDEYATEALRRKLKIEEHEASTSRARKLIPACCIGCTPSDLWSDFSMRSKIDDVTSRLEDLCRQRTELGLAEIAGRSTFGPRPPTASILASQFTIYGRDEDKAKILDMVLTDRPGDANFDVISILGMAGLGKTALARAVYLDESLKDFNLKAWVRVTTDFDVMKITTAILQSITERPCDLKDLHLVQRQLKNQIVGRKFLFVLDDVWNENYRQWTILRSTFMDGAHGSKIIVTTRHEGVVLTMGRSTECYKLKLLSDNDCLSLFEEHAFVRVVVGKPSSDLSQKVIEKCKGLPLVAKTLGDLLRCEERGKWLDILNSPLWQSQDKSDIPATLLISYHYLPSYLKRCFSYCAVLPKGYEFEKKELILLWMAEGLIQQSSENKQLEDLGSEYFHDLLSRSIFEISSSKSSKYIMHDLFNDMAQKVSRNLSFRLEDETNHRSNISKKTRYASYICHAYNDKRKFEVFNVAVHLRTHLSMPNDWATTSQVSHTVISDLLLTFKKLRVLSIQNYCINGIPDSISGLRLLRYLNLSNSEISSIPESINSMCNLQTLILRNCHKLLKWPCSMGNLINLRHLDFLGASSIKEMPMGVRKWKCLRTLSNFIVGKDSKSSLKDLKHLKFLWGELHISGLENVIDLEDMLSDKKDLKVLLLEWGSWFDESRDGEVDKKVLDMLRPHQNLEKLTIKCYGGTKFSSWVGSSSFSKCKMTVLELIDCRKCTSLPSLGLLGSLKSLTVKDMNGVKNIGSEFYGEHCSNPFQSLETLYFENLEEWECWDLVRGNESFPKLQELSIVNCRKCTSLPSLGLLGSLKSLTVKGMSGVKSIGLEFYGAHCSNPFQSLETLYFENLEEWECWDPVKEKESFPKLQELSIVNCPKLSKSLPKNPSLLKKLVIRNCAELVVSLSTFSEPSELEFDECKKIFYNISPTVSKSLNLATLSNISHVVNWLEQDFQGVEVLIVKGSDELIKLWRNEIVLEKPLQGLIREHDRENGKPLTTLLEGINQKNAHLEELQILGCPSLMFIFRGQLPPSLKKLCIINCEKLQYLLDDKEGTVSSSSTCHLEELYIYNCPSLRWLPSRDQLSATLTRLHLSHCSKLTTLSSRGQLPTTLKELKIHTCSDLTAILSRGQLPEMLETLDIADCPKLKSIVERFHSNMSLRNISIKNCPNLVSFQKTGWFTKSLVVRIDGDQNLQAQAQASQMLLSSLEELTISNCPKLTSLPISSSNCPKLKSSEVHISNCPFLK